MHIETQIASEQEGGGVGGMYGVPFLRYFVLSNAYLACKKKKKESEAHELITHSNSNSKSWFASQGGRLLFLIPFNTITSITQGLGGGGIAVAASSTSMTTIQTPPNYLEIKSASVTFRLRHEDPDGRFTTFLK